jgi:uncharacterized membrane protein YbaN (DUF454 family)
MPQTTETSVPRWLRPLYVAAGVLFLGLGVVGLFLPLIPTTGPLLLAAFFFGRGSERLHRWLTTHPRFGKLIADFEAGRGIPRTTKIVAVVMMAAAFGYSTVTVADHLAVRALIAAVGVGAILFVLRLPTAPTEPK